MKRCALGVRSISWRCCESLSSPLILYVRVRLEAFPGSGRGNIRWLRPNSSRPVSDVLLWLQGLNLAPHGNIQQVASPAGGVAEVVDKPDQLLGCCTGLALPVFPAAQSSFADAKNGSHLAS